MNEAIAVHPDEAQLLLYLAGELSADRRAMFERRLAAEPALRRQLDDLRRMDAAVNQGLSAADAAEPIDSRLRSLDRQIGRIFSQYQIDRIVPSAVAHAPGRVRRVPMWLYPLSAAAVVMMCLGVWYLSLDENPNRAVAPPETFGSNFGGGFAVNMDIDPEEGIDMALSDAGSDTHFELEREIAAFRVLNETLQ